jgi:5,10-methenyltetrahydrofolate synthetase
MNDQTPHPDRSILRRQLLAQREGYAAEAEFIWASAELGKSLADAVLDLAPDCLGGYWPMRSEFNPWVIWPALAALPHLQRALPWATRTPRAMSYRLWDGAEPKVCDDYGIPASNGEPAEPDVLLVPCLGYTRNGWRLGYGGGFFDRYMLAHPRAIAVGVAWSWAELRLEQFEPHGHDRPLSMIVTEQGIVMG